MVDVHQEEVVNVSFYSIVYVKWGLHLFGILFWSSVADGGQGQRSVYRFRIKVVAFVVDFKLLLLLLLLIYDVNVFTVKVNGAFAGSLHFQGVNTRLACC